MHAPKVVKGELMCVLLSRVWRGQALMTFNNEINSCSDAYRTLHEEDAGAFGSVQVCQETETGSTVAIKYLKRVMRWDRHCFHNLVVNIFSEVMSLSPSVREGFWLCRALAPSVRQCCRRSWRTGIYITQTSCSSRRPF